MLECNLKNDRTISVCFQGKLFNITVIQVYAPNTSAEEAEAGQFYTDLQDLLELTSKKKKKKKKMSFSSQRTGMQKSRDTWSNRQVWPWSTKWSRAKLTEFCQENTLIIAKTLFQWHKRRLYTWTSPDGQHWNQTDYIHCSQRWKSSIQPAKTRLGADCSSDHELRIAKLTFKLKKVGKTTRPFRYDLTKSLTIIQWKWEIDSRDQIW